MPGDRVRSGGQGAPRRAVVGAGLLWFAATMAMAAPASGQGLSAACSLAWAGDRATISLRITNRTGAAAGDVAGALVVGGDDSAALAVLAAPRPWRELLPGKAVTLRWSATLSGAGRLEVSAGATARDATGASIASGDVACGTIALAAATPRRTATPTAARPTRTPPRGDTPRPTRTPPATAVGRRSPTSTQRPTRTPIPIPPRAGSPTATRRSPAQPADGRALDAALVAVVRAAGIPRLDPGPRPRPAKVELGRALMFDRILSGNRDISCATCHHPSLATGDARALPLGTGGRGLGPARRLGAGRPVLPRNAPELFNRGAPQWTTMFWDARVSGAGGSFRTPAGGFLPPGLDSVLAAQAMFPVLSRDEMRGRFGDRDVFGAPNELAAIDSDDVVGVWDALMSRLLAVPGYVELFARAYPGVPVSALGFEHAANALAAFESAAFTLLDSPWDRYLRLGDRAALSADAKRGALLFFGPAGCASCHSGPLFTDQRSHNLAVPQVGPGAGAAAPLDVGRTNETGSVADRFTFRTPPLRNVALTGPWMHDGAFATLEGAVRHHLDPAASLHAYDVRQLEPPLRDALHNSPAIQRALLATLAPELEAPRVLSDDEVNQLLAFLEALTDPAALDLRRDMPRAVPSGLPVRD